VQSAWLNNNASITADLAGVAEREERMPIKCDFCAHRRCAWRFRVIPFQPDDPRHPSPYEVEEWAACSACYELIRAEDYEALAVRTVDTISNPAVMPIDTVRQELVRAFRHHYEEFATHRIGPPLLCVALPEGFDDLLAREGMCPQGVHREQVGRENGGPTSRPDS
jgi:hypothetical protein